MTFNLPVLAIFLACLERAASQQTISNFSLYAYGRGLTPGLRLFYGDGQAYVGFNVPSFVSEAVNITFAESGDDVQFVATPDRTTDWTALPTMYVDNSTDAYSPIGFVLGNETLGDGLSDSGFGLYGGWAFHKNGDGEVEMKFHATPTNETDVYLVKWNAGSSASEGDVPIALRTMAPTVITR